MKSIPLLSIPAVLLHVLLMGGSGVDAAWLTLTLPSGTEFSLTSGTAVLAIAERGGLIGIGFWEEVTCDDTPAGIAASIAAAIDLVGEDHVSLGSDFDGAVRTRFDASELAALTQALMDKGLAEPTIAKVMGGNMVRFLGQALPAQ